MAEIVNLRRARKAKTRAQSAKDADTNRVKHGVAKSERTLEAARAEKIARALAGKKLDGDGTH